MLQKLNYCSYSASIQFTINVEVYNYIFRCISNSQGKKNQVIKQHLLAPVLCYGVCQDLSFKDA